MKSGNCSICLRNGIKRKATNNVIAYGFVCNDHMYIFEDRSYRENFEYTEEENPIDSNQ